MLELGWHLEQKYLKYLLNGIECSEIAVEWIY